MQITDCAEEEDTEKDLKEAQKGELLTNQGCFVLYCTIYEL